MMMMMMRIKMLLANLITICMRIANLQSHDYYEENSDERQDVINPYTVRTGYRGK